MGVDFAAGLRRRSCEIDLPRSVTRRIPPQHSRLGSHWWWTFCAFAPSVAILMLTQCYAQSGSDATTTAAHRTSALIAGSVTDAADHKPLSGAIVEWRRSAQQVRGTTDANGRFTFAVPVAAPSAQVQTVVSVAAWSNLYEATRRDAEVRSGQTSHIDFALRQKPASDLGKITGRVTNTTTGQGVPGVTITIAGAGSPLSTQTGADGSYSLAPVGLGQLLTIKASTEFPPCLAEGERSFAMMRPEAIQDFALPGVVTVQLYCPSSVPHQLPPPIN
jgi:hypothetical protein